MLKIFAALTVLVLTSSSPVVAKDKNTKTTNTQQKLPDTDPLLKYAVEPFDPTADILPPGFKGHSCREITRKLKLSTPEKDEFESSSAYADRVAHIADDVLYGHITGRSVVAFVPEKPLLSMEYNADIELMTLHYFPVGSEATRVSGSFVRSVVLDSKLTDHSDYIGENGYGKKVTVRRSSYNACAVSFSNVSSITNAVNLPTVFTFNVPTEYAKTLKGNLGVLYVGPIKAPYVTHYGNYVKPTIDNPIELIFSGDSVVIKLSQMIIFDTATGKILAKTEF